RSLKYKLSNYVVTEKLLKELPLFSSQIIDMDINKFHPSFKTDDNLDYLQLSMRAENLMSYLNITTIGELLMHSAEQLLQNKNCGRKTIENIHSSIKNYLLIKNKDLSLNWNSFNSMIKSLMKVKDRDFKIFLNKLGVGFDKSQTLDKAGKEFGLTRERTRQILDRLYNLIKNNPTRFLVPLWDIIDFCLDKYYGVVHYDRISLEVCSILNWQNKLEGHALAEFASNCENKYFVDHFNRVMCLKNNECLNCSDFVEKLSDLIEAKGKIPLNEVPGELKDYCLKNCSEKKDKILDSGMFMFSAQKIENIRRDDHFFYSSAEYKRKLKKARIQRLRKKGAIHILTEDILEQAGKALTGDEIEKKLLEQGKSLKHGLAHIAKYCNNIFRWGWGIYIHKKYIKIPYLLIGSIHSYILSELQSEIPFLSVHKVFKKFEVYCKNQNIPSEMALYTTLVIMGNKNLVLPQFPAIFLSRKYANDTIYSILEDYLLEKNEIIDYYTFYDFFINDVGLKKQSFQWYLEKDDNIVKLPQQKISHKKFVYKTITPQQKKNEKKPAEITKPPSYEKPKKVLNLIEKCKSVKIPLSNVEKKLIETFQKNNNSFSKTRLIFFSRRNHVDSLKLINELNELFSEKYKEKLILYKANYFYFNHRFLNDSGWK
ncbi:MAG TPA: hypothetical protein ENL20_01415, partial [Candidatus Cloacimonetes bacterium]|nr:hypothetical protein [Candidatus Cloacimonadota bacterium]